MKYRFAALAATLLLGSALNPSLGFEKNELNPNAESPGSSQDNHPDGRGNRNRQSPPRGRSNGAGAGGAVVTGNGISYHGGPVMHGPVNLYYIWYGDWTKDAGANQILTDWGQNIGGSPYENINTTYGDSTGNVSGAISLVSSTTMSSSTFGTALSDASIASIVSNAISSGLPSDTNGLYFVLTAPDITETSGFITQYCGWHTAGTFGGKTLKYSFVGNAQGPNLGSCAWQTGSSPNQDPAADAMVSVMAHELEETASDPNLNAWYDASGEENADKCAWTFGSTHPASGGGIANMRLGNRDYLIQQNWVNANGGYCALSYNATPDFSLSVSPTSQALPVTGGTTGNYTITATPSGGFGGTVNYSISGLPAGVSASPIINGAFTLTAVGGIAASSYPFTITGTSTNPALTHSITANLVISAPPQPSFTISISPSSQSVSRGNKATYTVTITPANGFTGNVALTPGGAKTGLTLALNPTSVSISGSGSATSTLTATTTSSAKRNTNTLTVTGTSGSISKSASASLRIN